MNYYLFYTLFLLLNPLSLIFFALSFCLLHQFCCAVLLCFTVQKKKKKVKQLTTNNLTRERTVVYQLFLFPLDGA